MDEYNNEHLVKKQMTQYGSLREPKYLYLNISK